MLDLVNSIHQGCTIEVRGRSFNAIAMGRYMTETNPTDEYYKVFMQDHHVLVIAPTDSMMYLGRDHGDLGQGLMDQETIDYDGRRYNEVAKDRQIVKAVVFGTLDQIEGEVLFRDYVAEGDDTKLLSLAIVLSTGKRSDIVADVIGLGDIAYPR